jgi:hypothetical protein
MILWRSPEIHIYLMKKVTLNTSFNRLVLSKILTAEEKLPTYCASTYARSGAYQM